VGAGPLDVDHADPAAPPGLGRGVVRRLPDPGDAGRTSPRRRVRDRLLRAGRVPAGLAAPPPGPRSRPPPGPRAATPVGPRRGLALVRPGRPGRCCPPGP